MKVLWTLLKVILALALIIPLGIIALATVAGVLGALVGLAVLALRIAVIGLVAYGAFKLVSKLMGWGPTRPADAPVVRSLPPRDPHFEAAMRELDQELPSTK